MADTAMRTGRSRRRPPAASSASSDLATGSNAPEPLPHTLEQAIGNQIRLQRQRLGLRVADLANAAGLSAGMISKIEGGQISPSLATLKALAEALNSPLSGLFAAYEGGRDCSYVRAGEGVAITRRGTKAGHHYQLLGHSLAGDIVVEPYLITLSTEASPYTTFRHAGVELIYMLTGRVVYRHADGSYPLAPGDTLFFDAAAAHGPEVLTQLPMTYLSIIIYPRG